MKKKIATLFLIASMFAPSVAGAQISTAELNQELQALINQAIELINQLIVKLSAELDQTSALNQDSQSPSDTGQATTTDEISEEPEEKPAISITSENLIYKFDGSEAEDRYLVNLTLKAKKNSLKLTLYYYTYSSDNSQSKVQTNEIFRSIDEGETISLNDVKYSIEMKDSIDRWVKISEWFDITEASATSRGEAINVEF